MIKLIDSTIVLARKSISGLPFTWRLVAITHLDQNIVMAEPLPMHLKNDFYCNVLPKIWYKLAIFECATSLLVELTLFQFFIRSYSSQKIKARIQSSDGNSITKKTHFQPSYCIRLTQSLRDLKYHSVTAKFTQIKTHHSSYLCGHIEL